MCRVFQAEWRNLSKSRSLINSLFDLMCSWSFYFLSQNEIVFLSPINTSESFIFKNVQWAHSRVHTVKTLRGAGTLSRVTYFHYDQALIIISLNACYCSLWCLAMAVVRFSWTPHGAVGGAWTCLEGGKPSCRPFVAIWHSRQWTLEPCPAGSRRERRKYIQNTKVTERGVQPTWMTKIADCWDWAPA